MGRNVIDLLNYLRLEGSCDKDLVPHASDEVASPAGDESADEGKAVDKGENSEEEPIEEKTLRRSL